MGSSLVGHLEEGDLEGSRADRRLLKSPLRIFSVREESIWAQIYRKLSELNRVVVDGWYGVDARAGKIVTLKSGYPG